MTTPVDQLITQLSQQTPPSPSKSSFTLPATLLVGGLAIAALGVVFVLGVRADLAQIWATPAFMLKIALGISALITGAVLLRASWQPRLTPVRLAPLWLALLSLVVTGLLSEGLSSTAPGFLPGWACALSIMALSLPLMLGLTGLSRLFAPTSLGVTAQAAALTACGPAIILFALHCPFNQTPLILFWYGLGLIGTMVLGNTALQRLLRWA